MKYITSSLVITDTPDNYENGENPSKYNVFESDEQFEADSIPELINKIGETYLDSTNVDDFMKCAVVMDDSVSISGMVDELGYPGITESEWEDWKTGEIDLIAREIRFDIEKVVSISHDELVNAFNEDLIK